MKGVCSDDVKLYDLTKVKLKTAGTTQVVRFTAGKNKSCPVRNVFKDIYFDIKTGELKKKKKSDNRYQPPKSVMTDGRQAFLEAKLFLRKFKRYLVKQSNFTDAQKTFQYITIAEPQGGGKSWNMHGLLIFYDVASFIANQTITECGAMELRSRIKFLMQMDWHCILKHI